MNKEAGWEISKGLGHAVEKQIQRGGWVANPEGDQVRVGFKYKRLVGWCYQCGRFDHEMKDCPSPGPT